jgi:hypothetical protein
MPKKKVFVTGCFDMLHSGRIRTLAAKADGCWRAILSRDEEGVGRQGRASFEAQISIFPGMMDSNVLIAVKQYAGKLFGWKLSGAGTGGYLVLVGRRVIPGAIQLKIRRNYP